MDEQLKQRLMVAIFAFNFSLITTMIVTSFSAPQITWSFFIMRLTIGAGIGLVAAIGGYIVMQMAQK